MVAPVINLNSRRAYEARLGQKIGRKGYRLLVSLTIIFLISAILLLVLKFGFGAKPLISYILGSLALVCFVISLWWKRYLSIMPVSGSDLTSRLSGEVLGRLNPNQPLSSKYLWAALSSHWQVIFILNHLLLPRELVTVKLEQATDSDLDEALDIASHLADQNKSSKIEPVYIVAGLMLASREVKQLMIDLQARPEDIESVANWLGRNIVETSQSKKRNFGGIGRDWAFGFTPILNRIGSNLSLSIVKYGSHFGWLTESSGVKAMESAFSSQSHAIALIGPIGIGKTNSVYAFAQRLIEGKTSQTLAYHQVIAINATDIVSKSRGPGSLEHLMISLANEIAHAGHIILFLDDAEAFFSEGLGAFDASQILQSIVQSKSVPLIMALTPNGYQRLKAKNQTLSSLLTPVYLQELPEASTMRVLEDEAVGLENKHQILIAYEALQQAYLLSGRYNQDEAYPGKAIKLLEQSISYKHDSVVNRVSLERAIEQAYGVKVGTAAPVEANQLLNLESMIHERMINQTHAVSVVANSLRRSRAGVTNPKRPIGSFLFLGPTGVGKTELAKSLADTYFGDESNLIRLDMSEYQQSSDLNRLLSDGKQETSSLIMAERQKPFSVVLLDEIEKAHPNVLNLLLQLLDEGQLTDVAGRAVSFKDSIIIATSNAGSQLIRAHVEKGEPLDSFRSDLIEELIKSDQFKPELINRFDDIVLFRPLSPNELAQVVNLMLKEVNTTLANQNISVELTLAAITKIVELGYDPRLGARPLRRTLQQTVENTIAQKILRNEARPGDHLKLDVSDLSL